MIIGIDPIQKPKDREQTSSILLLGSQLPNYKASSAGGIPSSKIALILGAKPVFLSKANRNLLTKRN